MRGGLSEDAMRLVGSRRRAAAELERPLLALLDAAAPRRARARRDPKAGYALSRRGRATFEAASG